MHFNGGWIIQRALVDVIAQCTDAVDIFMETWLSACMCVFLARGRPCEREDKGFNSACMPVCVVVCCINRKQLWFILRSQCWGPLYLTGKVKAYSLEAILQRSSCSLGMRNRMTGRKELKICAPLLSSDCVLTTHTVCSKYPGSIYPLVLSTLSLLSSSYHRLPAIPPISHAIKIADLDKGISRDCIWIEETCILKWWWVTKGNCKQRALI